MQAVVGPALRGARSLDRARFLPQKALARFPWNSLLDAAEDAQRRFGNINTLEYEAAYDEVLATHGIASAGPSAAEEVHEKGAVLLAPEPAQLKRLLRDGTAREMASCQQAGWPDARAGFKRLAVAAACIARGHVAKAEADRQKYGHLHAGEDKR